jgi:hypothetical protein
MNPEDLAKLLIKTMGDADYNTAHTALEIAKLLLIHRDSAARRFVNDQSDLQSGTDCY